MKKAHYAEGIYYEMRYTQSGETYMVRRIHGWKLHWEKIHIERRHTQKGDIHKKKTHGVGTHIKGSNIYDKGNTRNRDYTEKGEGTNMGGEDILVEGGEEIYGKESIRNGNYTEKVLDINLRALLRLDIIRYASRH